MHRYLKSLAALFVCSAALAIASPAFAQTTYKPPVAHENSHELQPLDCKKNPLLVGCPPQQKYPKASSKEECKCELIRVKSGKSTMLVRNCYVKLPDDTVYYCKNPLVKLPKK